jgi:Tol biopolymer transport system component
MLKLFIRFAIAIVPLWLSGCSGYPRLLSFPYDAGGRSLNSRGADVEPQMSSPYLVFISDRKGSPDVYLFDAQARRLIDLPGLNSLDEIAAHPSISEDGRYIVYAGSRQGKTNIFLFDRETLQKRNLTENLAADLRNPVINASGTKIAYQIARNGQWDIRICDLQGNPLPITGNAP